MSHLARIQKYLESIHLGTEVMSQVLEISHFSKFQECLKPCVLTIDVSGLVSPITVSAFSVWGLKNVRQSNGPEIMLFPFAS